nr:FtsW/RodA/SpoVE family cell cycle protein [Treponemataceae bacterium]
MDTYQFFADRTVGRYRKSDFFFIASMILLLGLGIFTLYFCSQNYAERMFKNPFHFVCRQLICVGIGFAGFALFACLRIEAIRKMLPALFGITLIFCLLTFVPGISVEKNGAARWIKMPLSFTLQPSEIVKFTLVILLANFFDKQAAIVNPEERSVFPCVVTMLFFIGLVLLQQDLSTPLFIFCVCFAMFLAAGLNIKWVFAVAVVAVPLLFLFITSESYRIDRIIAFLRPEDGIHTFNYQSIAAKRAISAGGFWGAGIGTGFVQSNRIPEVQADYIFAGWSEAMGLGGVFLYFAVLGVFAWRGYRAALFCRNRFAAYSAFGFVTMIVGQSLLNCGVV